jgi:hypothetical protein
MRINPSARKSPSLDLLKRGIGSAAHQGVVTVCVIVPVGVGVCVGVAVGVCVKVGKTSVAVGVRVAVAVGETGVAVGV